MKIKNGLIMGIYGALVAVTDDKHKFKAKVALDLSRNFKNIREVATEIEQIRLKTFAKYRQDNEETLTGEAAMAFHKEFSEVLNAETEVALIPIKGEDLDLETNSISIQTVISVLLDNVIVASA